MPSRHPRTPLITTTGVLALAAAMAATAAGCSSGGSNEPTAGASATPSATPERGVGGLGTAAGEPADGSTSPAPGKTSGGTKATAPAGPRIVTFRIKQKPQCPRGTNVAPIDAVPLIIEWVVERADQVELSVDGPGKYNTYPTTGSETFTFSCGGAPGTVEKHTYTVTTVGGGTPRKKTLTATATVNEIPNV